MRTSQDHKPLAYSVDQVLDEVPLSRSAIYRAMKEGQLRWRRCGSRRIVLASELEEFLEQLPHGESAA